jgi:hypothetical protein
MRFFIIIFSVIVFTSCSFFPSPEGFWRDYQDDYQTESVSDQGPWGGKRIIHWKKESGKFDKSDVAKFAIENGWSLQSDTIFDSSVTNKWTYDKKPIFPLYFKGFAPEFDFDYSGFTDYPRWITGDVKVLSFTTNYISIDPGTQEEVRINGFVILNSHQNEMTVYHMWGE